MSTSLVGDLMRRATSPEMFAAVVGAAATAIAKRASERATQRAEENPDEPEAHDRTGDEAPRAENDEEAEPAARAKSSDEEEATEDAPASATAEPEQREEEPSSAEEDSQESTGAAFDGDSVLGNERASVIRSATAYAHELTGRQVDTISTIERDEDQWRIGVEVVELRRVPSTTDVLASYEVVVDDDLQLVEYRRIRRYYRNTTDEGGLR